MVLLSKTTSVLVCSIRHGYVNLFVEQDYDM